MSESHREEIAKLEALYASNPAGRVFVHLAEALRKAGEGERARAILAEGLGRHGDSASGFVVLGRVLTDLRVDDEAEHAFRRVLELDAGNLIAIRGLADLSQRTSRHQEAVRWYSELLSRNPSDEEIRQLLDQAQSSVWGETQEAGGAAIEGDAAEQGDAAGPPAEAAAGAEWGEAEVAPFSAAPGDAGETEHAETEYGLLDLEALPGDLAAYAGSHGLGPFDDDADGGAEMLSWDDIGGADPDISDLLESPADTSLLHLEGGLEAEPVEIDALNIELEIVASPDDDLTLGAGAEASSVSEEWVDQPTESVDSWVGGESWVTNNPGVADQPAVGQGWMDWQETTERATPESEMATPESEMATPESEMAEPEADEADAETELDGSASQEDEPYGMAESEPTAAELIAAEVRNWSFHQQPTPGRESEAGLVTETMADLYLSQGFHQRAVEVYRVLLERRSGDEGLLAKLRQAEQAGTSQADPMAGGTEEDAGDIWLRGVGSAWAGDDSGGAVEETPYTWTDLELSGEEPEQESVHGATIEAYLRDLLSWRRAAGGEPGYAGVDVLLPATHPDMPETRSDADVTLDDGAGDSAAAGAGVAENDSTWNPAWEPWAQPAEGGAGEVVEEAVPEDEWVSADEEGSTETSAETGGFEPDQALGNRPPAWGRTPVEAAFDEWYSAVPRDEHAGSPADLELVGQDENFPHEQEANESRADGPEPSAAEEEDEDLAMFRSWLQSLKK